MGIALVLGVILTGCGHPRPSNTSSVKNEKPAATQTSKQPDKKSGSASVSPQSDKQQSSSNPGLPLGNSAQPQAGIDGILKPQGGNTQSPFGALENPGSAKNAKVPAVRTITPGKTPSPQQLLGVLQSTYITAGTLKIVGVQNMTIKQDGKTMRQAKNESFSMMFKRPNMFVITSPQSRLSSDGKKVYQYVSEAKRYVSAPMSNKVIEGMVMSNPGIGYMGLLLGLNYPARIASYKPIKTGKVGGQDAFILTVVLKGQPGSTTTQTLWISKKDLGIYKNRIVTRIRPRPMKGFKGKMPKFIETVSVSDITTFKPNAKLSNAAFKFKAPAGAKPVEKPKMINMSGKSAPDFAFKLSDGSAKKISDYRGKAVVLDIWAMPMCEKQLPTLQSLYKDHKDDLNVVTINFNAKSDAVKTYMKKKGYSFPYAMANEQIARIIAQKYGLRGIPTIFLIDRQGVIRETMLGEPSKKQIEAKLSKLGMLK